MRQAQFFEGSPDGPAKMKDPGCRDPECTGADMEEVPDEIDHSDADDQSSQNLPGLPAGEQILGLDEASADDPLCKMHVLQRLLRELRSATEQLAKKQSRLQAHGDGDAAASVAVFAGLEQCQQHFVSLRELSQKILAPNADIFSAIGPDKHCKDPVEAARSFLQQVLRHDPDADGANATKVNQAIADALEAPPLEGCAAESQEPSPPPGLLGAAPPPVHRPLPRLLLR